ncbi:MAG: ABC transporter substrate-binding protein, partial [Hyphomicrobiaceae bacterium]
HVEHLIESLKAGRMSRRDFMQGAIALGVTVHAATMMADQALAAPKKGGHVKMGLAGGSTTDQLDGATHSDSFMIMLGHGAVFDCLTEVTADGKLVGELAESWEASADAKTWTFKLRKGVTFHNGKSFGADDVIESLQHHVGEKSKSAAKPIVASITDMKKEDEHTVKMTLKAGNADFPYLMSDYHLTIFPAGMKDEAFKKGIGTGGYTLKSFEPGVRATGERYANTYKSNCYFDSYEFIGISDEAARMNSLITNEVDVINRVDLKTEKLLARNPNVTIFEVTGNQHYTFPMLMKTKPFDDNNVRMALKHGVNREELVAKILRGHGAIANDHPIGPANQYFAKDLPQTTYDPDKSKFYLKKAGLDSVKVDLSAADAAFNGAVDAAVLYKESASKGGIDINVVREPKDGYWSNVWLKKGWCACYWSGRATEDWMFSTAYEKGVPWNDTQWEHEKFNKILLEARAELDSGKRKEMYYEMQKITNQEGGVVIPMYANYVDAHSKKMAHGPAIGNLWQMDNSRMLERWWFA